MANTSGDGKDKWVDIPADRCLIRYAFENKREAHIQHGKIEIDGISVEKSFLCFGTKGDAEDVRENLSKVKGDSFLKSCLIISQEKYYWLAVDRFDYSLKRYCHINPERWEGSEVSLDSNQKKGTRYQLKPTYQQIVRDIVTGIYQLHRQKYWHGNLSITDILIVNDRVKFAFLRNDRCGDLENLNDKRKEDFKKLHKVFKEVLGVATGEKQITSFKMTHELKHFLRRAEKINIWQSLAKLFFHPLLMTPMQRFHLPVAMRTLATYDRLRNQWSENCAEGVKWIENVRGDYKEILSYRQNDTQDRKEYIDDAWGQFTFVRNTIVHFNDPQGKKVETATSPGDPQGEKVETATSPGDPQGKKVKTATSQRVSNRPKKTAKEVEQELSVMLPSSFTNVYNLFNVKALASTSVQIFEEKVQEEDQAP